MKGGTYQDVFSTYCDYVKKYGKAVVVFDGYADVSTKYMTHQRRAKKIDPTVAFTSQMPLTINKVEFLANKVNKQKFIALLGQELEKASCTVYHASGDADVLIVQKAVQSAQTRETILIGEDTDQLVLLCYYTTPELHPLYFMSEPKRNSKNRLWCMQSVISQLGSDICNNILFLHAIFGCDTTSHLHGIGKGNSIRSFKKINTSVSKLCHLIQHLHPSMILQLQVRMYWSAYTVGNQVKH